MGEEDAFWILVGIVKNMNNLLCFENKEENDNEDQYTKYQAYCPFTHRYMCLKKDLIAL